MASRPANGHAARRRIEHMVSAGGVVYRMRDGQMEVVLCGRSGHLWGLPKGGPNPGEKLIEAAAREATEETGLEVEVGPEVGVITYWFVRPEDKALCHKRVHFYLMTPTGGSLDRHDYEFDEVAWFPLEQALQTLTYQNEVYIVRRAAALAQPQNER